MSSPDDSFPPPSAPIDREVAALRLPPHSIEAEQAVLGGLMLDNQAFERVADILREDDFYRHDHRLVWQQISRLIERNQPADVVTVFEALKTAGKAEEAGGLQYLNALAQETPSAANVRRYGEIVRDRAILRRLIATSDQIATEAFNPQGKDTRQLLDEAESRIFKISEDGSRGAAGFQPLTALISQVVERIDTLYNRGGSSDVTGVPTGFSDLDRMTSGLQPGDLVIVAGRPSMGKAQPDDAPVRTPQGWVRIDSLRVGDAIASVDGRPSRVTGVYPQGRRPVWRLRFSDGRQAVACAEHLWRVRVGRGVRPRVVSTAWLARQLARPGTRVPLTIDLPEGRFGHHDPLPFDPFALGLLMRAADETAADDAARREAVWAKALAVLLQDAAMRARLGRMLREARVPALHDDDRLAANGIAADAPGQPDARALRERLCALGLWAAEPQSLRLPACFLEAGRESRIALLDGLLGASAQAGRDGLLRLTVRASGLARDLTALVRSLGGWCHARAAAGISARSLAPVRLAMSLPALPGLGCQRVHGLPARPPRRPALVAIEPAGEARTRCISVSHPSRLYITSDDCVTHNTAFSLNIGEHVAVDQGLPVAVFSMEMGATQLALRMVCSVGRLDQQRLRTGRLVDDDWPRLTNAIQKMQEVQLHIDETPALNALELRARARRLSRQCGQLGLVIVDYLQLMSASSSGENRATEISEISRSLKALAKELNCPVIALSQLNRSLEQRPNKRPVMSDLRESGAIEQDADVILFIYRDEVYNPDSAEKGTAEIIIGKQRNGPIGTVRLTFVGQYTKFENFTAGSV
ncbi:MAG: replicative DNA helicase [Betaproteobacteria bacterium]|nr:replicative DNA helicase [Betaproteobacteria bacterium]